MTIWTDLKKPEKKHEHIILGEIFDTSTDILTWVQKEEKKMTKKHGWFRAIKGFFHFVLLTSIIFIVLLLVSNWPAYSAFARSVISPEKLETEQVQLEAGIANTEITKTPSSLDIREERRQKVLRRKLANNPVITQNLGADYFNQDIAHVSLSVNIAPYEDRIIIPKIGKNIPLVDVENHSAETSTEWEKIFMKELEKGVVKYPGSADPGKKGNSFIFGHSSNYPWAKGDYNDVFALLNELSAGDEVIVYFQQTKYTYVVKEKLVVKPGHVSSIGGDMNDERLTLMTCWPLGTTLNRLLIVTELKDKTNTI